MRPLVFALTLSFIPLTLPHVAAQEALLPEKPQTAEVRPDAIAKGEIGLEGRVKAISGPNTFDIAASSFTTQDGRTIEFDEAKPKSIEATENALIASSSNLRTRLTMKEVKLGLRVRLVGRDIGGGKPFQARVIVLSDVSSSYRKGRTVTVTAAVAAMLRPGREAFDAGDYNRALSYFKQAQGIAAGKGDKPGLVMALSRQGSSYKELNQLQKSEEAFKSALQVAETGSPDDLPAVLINYGTLLRRLNRLPEAITLLERAHALATGENEASQTLIGEHLGSLYKSTKQWDKAIEAWNSIVNRLRGEGELAEEIDTLLNISRAQLRMGRETQSAAALALAQERFKVLNDPAQRAQAQSSFGVHYLTLGDRAKARQFVEQSLAGFEAINDAVSAAAVRETLEEINKPAAPAAPAATTPATATRATAPPALPDAPDNINLQ